MSSPPENIDSIKEKQALVQFVEEKRKKEQLNKLLSEKIPFDTLSSSPKSLFGDALDKVIEQKEKGENSSVPIGKVPKSSSYKKKNQLDVSILSQKLNNINNVPKESEKLQSSKKEEEEKNIKEELFKEEEELVKEEEEKNIKEEEELVKEEEEIVKEEEEVLKEKEIVKGEEVFSNDTKENINDTKINLLTGTGIKESNSESQNSQSNEELHENINNEINNNETKDQKKPFQFRESIDNFASIYSWGRGGDGQLGHGDLLDAVDMRPIEFFLGNSISQISCGGKHNLIINIRGEVYSFGWNYQGQLGNGDLKDELLPKVIKSLSLAKALRSKNFISVSSGSEHSLSLTDNGEVYSWGGDTYGTLGNGGNDRSPSLVPRLVLSLHQVFITKISCGGFHNLALSSQGQLYSWGRGSNGRLGHGNEQDHYIPTLIHQQIKFAEISCGFSHCLAISSEKRKLYSWGKGEDGMLGHGDTEDRKKPTIIDYLKNIRISSISAGYYHSAAISENSRLFTWGYGEFGQLGLGTCFSRISTPQEVQNLDGVLKVACGGFHTLCITNFGQLYSFGLGEHGQLGNGRTENRYFPYLIPTKRKCIDIACGFWHSLAIFIRESRKTSIHTFTHEYSKNWLNLVIKQLQDKKTGIPRRKRTFFFSTYELCFTGTEFVDFLLKNQISKERKNSIEIGRYLLSINIIEHVDQERDFEDDMTLYRFVNEYVENSSIELSETISDYNTLGFSQPTQRRTRSSSLYETITSWFSPIPSKEVVDTLKTKEIEDKWVEILKNWNTLKNSTKTKKLWRQGIPNNIRGRVWLKSITNHLKITPEIYQNSQKTAYELKQKSLRETNEPTFDFQRLIDVDIARTWSQTGLFVKAGPFYNMLVNVLESFSVFLSDLGYVQGMSYFAGMLMLYLPGSYEAFYCLTNILQSHFFYSLFKMDINSILQHVKIYEQLFSEHLPSLYKHFTVLGISPEHYLLDWFMTIFAKALPIQISSRCWDCFMMEGEIFIFRIAVGILKLLKGKLQSSDFETCIGTLRNLNIAEEDEDCLFDSIFSIKIPQHIINISKKLDQTKTDQSKVDQNKN